MLSDDDLEGTIARLIHRMRQVDDESAEYRLIVRQLEGLLG